MRKRLDRIKDCTPVWWCYLHYAMPQKRGWCVGVCKAPPGANVGDVVRMCLYIGGTNMKDAIRICRERQCDKLCLSVQEWPRAVDFSLFQAPMEVTDLAGALLHASAVATVTRAEDVKAHREFLAKINKGGKT